MSEVHNTSAAFAVLVPRYYIGDYSPKGRGRGEVQCQCYFNKCYKWLRIDNKQIDVVS